MYKTKITYSYCMAGEHHMLLDEKAGFQTLFTGTPTGVTVLWCMLPYMHDELKANSAICNLSEAL